MKTGSVYFIHTTDWSRFYIGSTGDARIRRKSHMAALRGRKHHCNRMQRVFNKRGDDSLQFTVAMTVDSREEAAQLEHDVLTLYFGTDQCMNTSSNGLMSAQCPVVVAKRNKTLKSAEHRLAASELAKQWRRENPVASAENDRRSIETRSSAKCREANAERGRLRGCDPVAIEAFKDRIKRFYANGGVNGFAKPIYSIDCDGVRVDYPSGQAGARATPGASATTISRCCYGKQKATGGCTWGFA